MKLITRKATLADLPILLHFEQGIIEAERPMDPTLKEENITYYDISLLIKNDNSEVFVVTHEDRIIASGYAKIIKDKPYLKHEYQGYLGFMFVEPAYRGKGVNKLITDALLQWCKERKVYEIRLDVYDTNPAALRAYEKAGFTKNLINMRLDITHRDV